MVWATTNGGVASEHDGFGQSASANLIEFHFTNNGDVATKTFGGF